MNKAYIQSYQEHLVCHDKDISEECDNDWVFVDTWNDGFDFAHSTSIFQMEDNISYQTHPMQK